ncbi:MAG TPA: glycosyltransferase N-terminal domain-containing protein [Flavisolibacter sp.]|nr:glycosyltransferase N-terminal domain-containing protein [Flavisolibacter sp.]
MAFFYTIFIRLYVAGIRVAGLVNAKAAEWHKGRKGLFEDLAARIAPQDRLIWVHCASAGELEQGKPVIEALKRQYPRHKILVSFFSPSGYAVGLKYKEADLICYLPADTASNAKRFIGIVKPELVVFIKYEYWYHHLSALAFRHIPVLLVSAIFRPGQAFFKWYGSFYRQILFLFRHIFVQDEESLNRLKNAGISHCSVSGDTRFDRVAKIALNAADLPLIASFTGGSPTLVAGSTWPDDEQLLAACIGNSVQKLIIAPHEINEGHLEQIDKLFPDSIRYSSLVKDSSLKARVLVIDNIGMLSRLYRYGTLAYIGGGFNKSGIHNTLEAAVWGKPVLFGPQYQKFREARELVALSAAFSVRDQAGLQQKLAQWLENEAEQEKAGLAAGRYVQENTGATGRVLEYVQANRLLTS